MSHVYSNSYMFNRARGMYCLFAIEGLVENNKNQNRPFSLYSQIKVPHIQFFQTKALRAS